jgi:hypothetical protein
MPLSFMGSPPLAVRLSGFYFVFFAYTAAYVAYSRCTSPGAA